LYSTPIEAFEDEDEADVGGANADDLEDDDDDN
jgi:hypothetical protein